MDIQEFIKLAFEEDSPNGDQTTLACIPADERGKAVLKIKDDGVLAGTGMAEKIFKFLEPDCKFTLLRGDGSLVEYGDEAFTIEAKVHTILTAERFALNLMQRMSGIATLTSYYVDLVKDTGVKILDTRKTTPLLRRYEKEAVRLGGGYNHRRNLSDMIMLKDNHIDFCGGIEAAIRKTQAYLKDNNLDLAIEVETRNLEDVEKVMHTGGVQRIMLDNYSSDQVAEAVKLINHQFETEASGEIDDDNIREYAQTGVDFISIGALTHHAVNLDLSLKAI